MAYTTIRNRPTISRKDDEEKLNNSAIHQLVSRTVTNSTSALFCCLQGRRLGKEMGPKNTAVICKSPPARELSWFERMFEKLESVCMEVDRNPSSFVQGTAKYVENQANVVGSNVRKFYTELMQDLLPPSTTTSELTVMKYPPEEGPCDFVVSESEGKNGSSSVQITENVIEAKEESRDEGSFFIMKSETYSRLEDVAVPSEKSGNKTVQGKIGHAEQWPLYNEAQKQVEDEHYGAEPENMDEQSTDLFKSEDYTEVPYAIMKETEQIHEQLVSDEMDRSQMHRRSKSLSLLASNNEETQDQGFLDDFESEWELV